jgi:hypothetical protein
MATKSTKQPTDHEEIQILEVERGVIDFFILGTTPLLCNRMSEKVWHELLAPKGRKTESEKQATMKHDPIQEFRDSPYIIDAPQAPTLLGIMPVAFKRAMGTAALDMPGAKKAQVLRLVTVQSEMFPVFGIPRLHMSITRSADVKKTPDVRTRAVLPEWAARVRITYTKPILRAQSITNLIAAAGFQSGVGDWRQEKGSGSFGCFKVVGENDPDWNRIAATGGRAAQIEAMENPVAYDTEAEEMLAWFVGEKQTRGFNKKGAVELRKAA